MARKKSEHSQNINPLTPIKKLMFLYVEAVNSNDTKLANKVIKKIEAMQGVDIPEKAGEVAPVKAKTVKPAAKSSKITKPTVKSDKVEDIKHPEKPSRVAKPPQKPVKVVTPPANPFKPAKAQNAKPSTKVAVQAGKPAKKAKANIVQEDIEDFTRPTRQGNFQAVDNPSGTHRVSQFRTVGQRGFSNKFVDNGMDDMPENHKKIDKKIARTKRKVKPREPFQKVNVTCFMCGESFMVHAIELERIGDDENIKQVKKIRCDRCISTR